MKNITVVILTFNTPENIILDCLSSINKDVKILIIENSDRFIHEEKILSKFANVNIKCTGKNLGYGGGNNFGISAVQTDYILILNPDVICSEDLFSNIKDVVDQNTDFSVIGCQYSHDRVFMPAGFFDKKKNQEFINNFKKNKIDDLAEVDWVTGCSMLLNNKKFKDKKIFDESFFLYFEEFDLCKSLINKGEKVYSSKKLRIHHLGFKSSFNDSSPYRKNINRVREWHWMWSSFYFYKKNYGYFYALKRTIRKLISSILKVLFYSLTFNRIEKEKYKYRFLGMYNSILNKPSSFRDNLK
tara:strand:+ start:2030 stop:2929 length:900 start_codon:yes stop_codon:yes gene_type:complete